MAADSSHPCYVPLYMEDRGALEEGADASETKINYAKQPSAPHAENGNGVKGS